MIDNEYLHPAPPAIHLYTSRFDDPAATNPAVELMYPLSCATVALPCTIMSRHCPELVCNGDVMDCTARLQVGTPVSRQKQVYTPTTNTNASRYNMLV